MNSNFHRAMLAMGMGTLCLFPWALPAAEPVVSNVRASQRPGTKLVDLWYNLADEDNP